MRHDRLGIVRLRARSLAGDLLDLGRRGTETRRFGGREYEVPFIDVDGYVVWGATAMILSEFLALVD